MAYEIPQSLKYEEKIIFGLTTRQLAYLSISCLPIAILFKTGLPFALKIIFSVMCVSIGGSFAFLKLDKKFFEIFQFYKSNNQLGFFDKKISEIIGVKKVECDLIILNDNSIVGILQVIPINFETKAETDQKAIIKNYQEFLNSLDFPIQLLVKTVNVDIDDYLKHLRTEIQRKINSKRSKMQKLFESYVEFIEDYLKNNSVKNKLFYVIIRGGRISRNKTENEKILTEIENRLLVCKEGLSKCGLKTNRIKSEALVPLMLSFFGFSVNIKQNYSSPLTFSSNNKTHNL
jgi:hypothetical protein